MDNEISDLFLDYIPADELTKLLKIKRSDLITSAMRRQINFYYPLKSDKRLTYYPVKGMDNIFVQIIMFFRTFVPIGLDNQNFPSGSLVHVTKLRHLNALGFKSLNEAALLSCSHNEEYVLLRHEKLRNTFHPVHFEDIFVPTREAVELGKQLKLEKEELKQEQAAESIPSNDTIRRKSKQAQREAVFIGWLTDQDENLIRNMKKDDVWEELRKINHPLFSVEPKNFFRDQKIITFKAGRKAS